MKKILFVTSEAHPLIKTGGLADVSGSLPKAFAELSQDVRLIMPNYQALNLSGDVHTVFSLRADNRQINILETRLPDSSIPVWLVDCPEFYNFPGNPYTDGQGNPWPNNAERFSLFCRIAVICAMDKIGQNWKADIVHCNDWQTGLVPALLSLEKDRPATVFTVHNLAYQGLFPASRMVTLNIPGQLWNPDGLEFHNLLSFIKGGLAFADCITTVSPTYAQEIQTSAFGYGLEGLLRYRNNALVGIINGIDTDQWNPETDGYIPQRFNVDSLHDKTRNKTELQQRMQLPVNDSIPVLGLISRLVEQKGIDMVLDCLPEMLSMDMQFVLLGSGDKVVEQRLQTWAEAHPDKIAVTLGYDESLAHLIEAGADIFLMPSRFEPCGLNQMYSQRYGTIPIVRKTGGLADTVIDTSWETLANGSASGIVFNDANSGSLLEAIKRTLLLYRNTEQWRKMQANAMCKDFTWRRSAEEYLRLYESIS
ncbi:MAG: glycogen synthase GlgA [Methylovulum sp.]|uniref:glycogen synthase GlgA n=1 Tax=Methylovulum sp. TaxID=1916980 RepID=UPI002625334D|nr:glycogen synthase GlgA [Methylovulum sp.]MDD2723379.1 glycogen synthase GlgA [Methylovulum sp.]MDD5125915.1 glycogen synthase GlgA [Methylovulum sp.]